MNFVIDKGWVSYWGTARWSPSEVRKYNLENYSTPIPGSLKLFPVIRRSWTPTQTVDSLTA